MNRTGMDWRKTEVGSAGVRQFDQHYREGGSTLATRARCHERVSSLLSALRIHLNVFVANVSINISDVRTNNSVLTRRLSLH